MWICIRLTHFLFTVLHRWFLCVCVCMKSHPTLFKSCIDKFIAVLALFQEEWCWWSGVEELSLGNWVAVLRSSSVAVSSSLDLWSWCHLHDVVELVNTWSTRNRASTTCDDVTVAMRWVLWKQILCFTLLTSSELSSNVCHEQSWINVPEGHV